MTNLPQLQLGNRKQAQGKIIKEYTYKTAIHKMEYWNTKDT